MQRRANARGIRLLDTTSNLVHSLDMSLGHVLLGLLADEERHGYDLKRQYGVRFPAARPLAGLDP